MSPLSHISWKQIWRTLRGGMVSVAMLMKRKWVRRGILLTLLSPILLLLVLTVLTPLPQQLREGNGYDGSVQVLDRHGKLLAEVRAEDGTRARWMKLDQVGEDVQFALMAAEDSRFRWHPGIDPIAIVRASFQNLSHGRIVSGASTLTQQLGRNLVPRPRTLPGKLKEMAVALRIELSLSKDEILESYLNLVHFGPTLRGVESASHFYFDKPSKSLSLAEAATLAAMPKGPTLYDPRRAPERLQTRRDHILTRMENQGWATTDQVQRAKGEPLTVHARPTGWSAPHLVRGLLDGSVYPELGPLTGRVSVLRTTIDGALQREVQFAARTLVSAMRDRQVGTASVVVIENRTGQVLSWVGAHDFFDKEAEGQNDGVIALRQPGSALKPFVYAVAMEDLGWTAATVLPDVELHLPGARGTYTPVNYDGQQHGPVRLREALANSYNIPAVYTASVVGPDRVLAKLRVVGFESLERDPDHYGAAIALGDGEVRLLDLANAYATLARGGEYLPVHALLATTGERGEDIALPEGRRERVISEPIAYVLTDILADPNARLASFGPDSVLQLPFPAAVKTGTSKGFRDNLTVGFTPQMTVAVWVGNFDGSPMKGVSGVSGAGPLFNAVMYAVHRHAGANAEEFTAPDDSLEWAEVCTLSGAVPNASCSHQHKEVFLRETAPDQPCAMHVTKEVDRRNGLLAGPGCGEEQKRSLKFESFESRYLAWAKVSKRRLVPTDWSPHCPGDGEIASAGKLSIRYPYPGAVYLDDPSMPDGMQGLVVRVDAPAGLHRIVLFVDGHPAEVVGPPFEHTVRLSPGTHEVWAEAGTRRSARISFEVR